jgi:hypothetical protein
MSNKSLGSAAMPGRKWKDDGSGERMMNPEYNPTNIHLSINWKGLGKNPERLQEKPCQVLDLHFPQVAAMAS